MKKTKGKGAPTREVKLPPTNERMTPEGLTVLVANRGPLPLVAARLVIHAGSAQDPADKHGLADFTARLLRRGVEGMDADQINETVEFVAGSLSISATEDYLVLSVTAPSEHLSSLLKVMAKLVREPTFPQAEVESARARLLAQFANDLDDPGLVADRALGRAVWGTHPYGHDLSGSPSHVKGFTRDDVVRFHKEKLGPKVSMLIVVGAVDVEEVQTAAAQAFAGWTGGPSHVVPPPPLESAELAGKVLLVDKPEQTQTQVRLASLGYAKGSPDTFAARVANTILGGGFTSRLVNEVRVNRGLSYGVGSYFDSLHSSGTFGISSFTKTESTRELLEVILGEVKKMRTKGPSAKELKNAQTYMAGLYPLQFETNEAIAAGIAEVRFYKLGYEWVEQYRERVKRVALKECMKTGAKYLFSRPPAIVLVGNAAAVKPQLKAYGEVRVIPASEVE
ncbi:MAG: M16 family metallopeptidase [Myxococcaceae bacterium]